jgi:hypothetical protein
MSTPSDQDVIDRVTRQCQIIVGALITGVVFFLGIATVIDMPSNAAARPGAGEKSAEGPGQPADARLNARPASDGTDFRVLLTWIAVAFAVMSLPMSFVVPGLIAQQNRRAIAAGTWPPASQRAATDRLIGPKESQTSTGQLAMVYQTQLIIASALNEGPAFFAGIVYLIGKDMIALGVGVLLIAVLASKFPTRDGVARWIDEQQEKLILDKQAAV